MNSCISITSFLSFHYSKMKIFYLTDWAPIFAHLCGSEIPYKSKTMIYIHLIKIFFSILSTDISKTKKPRKTHTNIRGISNRRWVPLSILHWRPQMADEQKVQDPGRNETTLGMGKENNESTGI